MRRLIFATNNKHKIEEVRAALDGKVEVVSLAEAGLEGEIPETADTLQGNALQKAQWVIDRLKEDCGKLKELCFDGVFADDTGLEVDALGGAPGVYSARYAGEHCSFDDNVNKLLAALDGETNRKADFRTVICLIETSRRQDFETSGHQDFETSRHRDIEASRPQDIETSRLQERRIFGCSDIRTFGQSDNPKICQSENPYRTSGFQDCRTTFFEGRVDGQILTERHSKGEGFGYDPIFMPDRFALSFAEMPLDVKNRISHRGLAVKKLAEYLNQE